MKDRRCVELVSAENTGRLKAEVRIVRSMRELMTRIEYEGRNDVCTRGFINNTTGREGGVYCSNWSRRAGDTQVQTTNRSSGA